MKHSEMAHNIVTQRRRHDKHAHLNSLIIEMWHETRETFFRQRYCFGAYTSLVTSKFLITLEKKKKFYDSIAIKELP